ncbi:MAG: hypothetical protein R3C68_05475 [Myxococcota bacterium]
MSDEFRNQVNEIWRQAVGQLEEVKDVLTRSRDRFEADIVRLKGERDRLLIKLGEQTLRLVNQGRVPVPAVVKRNVERLNEVIDGLVKHEAKRSKSKAKPSKKAKKTTARKKSTTARKTTSAKPRKASKKSTKSA